MSVDMLPLKGEWIALAVLGQIWMRVDWRPASGVARARISLRSVPCNQ